ncbi:MAG: hypothetical protein PHW08_14100 [Kiritimatiellae bacterium]|nr:hypothetical protein [Kiritimatiellia bacterium]
MACSDASAAIAPKPGMRPLRVACEGSSRYFCRAWRSAAVNASADESAPSAEGLRCRIARRAIAGRVNSAALAS